MEIEEPPLAADTSRTNAANGGVLELWKISLPLMISNFAALLMIFVDRIFLNYYSNEALISATSSGSWAWAFLGGFGMAASMSEIFVAQFFGANKLTSIGRCVWQMIWFSFFSLFFFFPLAFVGSSFLFPEGKALDQEYFFYLMISGPFYTLMAALSGFYIGRGKTNILISLAVLGNLLNVTLDAVLIYGVPGVVAEMGIKGAAIATSLGFIFQAVVLFFLFLGKEHRENFHTDAWRVEPVLFRKSFQVGLPQGLFYMVEMIGFAIFYELMSQMGKDHIIISGICQSFLILLSFFLEGLTRGVTAISGSFIGAKQPKMVGNVLQSGIYLQLAFSIFMALGFFVPNHWIYYLFPDATTYILSEDSKESIEALWFCLFCSFLYISFEGIRWVLAGILTAAGDTFFLLISGSLSVWLLLIFPIYFLVLSNHLSVAWAWTIFALYSLVCCGIYFWRYQKGAWKHIHLIDE